MAILACNSKSDITQNHQSRDEAWLASTVESMKSDFAAAKNDIEKEELKTKYHKIVYDYFDKRNNYIDSIRVSVYKIEAGAGLINVEFRNDYASFVDVDSYKDGDSVSTYYKSFLKDSDTTISFGFNGVSINDPESRMFRPIVVRVYPVILNRQSRPN